MNSGVLRHRVCVEEKVIARNAYGEEEITWRPLFYAWTSIDPLSGREYYTARQMQATTTHKMVMRYQAGIKPYQRITWDGRIFDIDAIANEKENKQYLTILATEEI
jgi:SPP1 family predicted phage head-tail adaptor